MNLLSDSVHFSIRAGIRSSLTVVTLQDWTMSALRNKSILILENEPLIAMAMELSLAEANFTEVRHFHVTADAERWLEDNTPSLAILDIHMREGQSSAVAETLVERMVPFIVYSGGSRRNGDYAEVFFSGEWIKKPAPAETRVAAVKKYLNA